MHAVGHAIGFEGVEHSLSHGFEFRNAFEHQGMCAGLKAGEMLFELVNLTFRNPQPFPNGVASLDDTVQHTDLGVFAFDQAIHPAPGSSISRIGLVEFGHGSDLQCVLFQGKVMFQALVSQISQMLRCVAMKQRSGFPAGAFVNAVVPVFGPNAVFRESSFFPSEHFRLPWQIKCVAQGTQCGGRIGEQRLRGDDCSTFAGELQDALLVGVSQVEQGGVVDVCAVGWQDPIGMPCQNHVLVLWTIKSSQSKPSRWLAMCFRNNTWSDALEQVWRGLLFSRMAS